MQPSPLESSRAFQVLRSLHERGVIQAPRLPGMRLDYGVEGTRVLQCGEWSAAVDGGAMILWAPPDGLAPEPGLDEARLDLSDPLTGIGLVLLAREAWAAPHAHLGPTMDGGWRAHGLPMRAYRNHTSCRGATEALAWLSVLQERLFELEKA